MTTEELKVSIIQQLQNEYSPMRFIMLKSINGEPTLKNSTFVKHRQFQSWEHRLRINVDTIKKGYEYSFQINFSEAERDGYPLDCEELNQYNGGVYFREHFTIRGNRLLFRLKKCIFKQENYQFHLDFASDAAKSIKDEDFLCVYDCDTGKISEGLSPAELSNMAINARFRSINDANEAVSYMDFGFGEKVLSSLSSVANQCQNKEVSGYLNAAIATFRLKNGLPMPGNDLSPMLYLMIHLFSSVRT